MSGLGMSLIMAFLHLTGKYPAEMALLYMSVSLNIAESGRCDRMVLFIPLSPGLVLLRLLIVSNFFGGYHHVCEVCAESGCVRIIIGDCSLYIISDVL